MFSAKAAAPVQVPTRTLPSKVKIACDVSLSSVQRAVEDLAVIQTADDPEQLVEAEAALERFLQVRQAAEGGKWANWYRGDKKVNVPALLEQTREARRRLLGPPPAAPHRPTNNGRFVSRWR